MLRTIIESPFAGDTAANLAYARAAVADSLGRGEAPLASHLIYTQPGIIGDGINATRGWGLEANLQWIDAADQLVVYTDRGISPDMTLAITAARRAGLQVIHRSLPAWAGPVEVAYATPAIEPSESMTLPALEESE